MAKSKSAVISAATFKNPLGIAFGMILKRERAASGKSSDELAKAIGIGESYYRLVESGTNNLHVSKIIRVVNAFDGRLSFDGVSKVMLALSLMEVTANKFVQDAQDQKKSILDAYILGLKHGVVELSAYDDKLKFLFSKFTDTNLFVKMVGVNQEAIEDEINNSDILRYLKEFLIRYEDFGKSVELIQSSYFDDFFDDLPTFYIDFLNNDKKRLLDLPIRIKFSDLWKWEDNCKDKFKSMICIFTDPNDVSSIDNLRRYKYRHLWGKEYNDARFVCTTQDSELKVKDDFKKNLKQSLKEANEVEMLKTFENKTNKLNFKTVNETSQLNTLIKEILTDKDLDSDMESSKIYDAFWVHTFYDGSCVGFVATINKDNAKLVEGISLTFKNTMHKIQLFNQLWKEIK